MRNQCNCNCIWSFELMSKCMKTLQLQLNLINSYDELLKKCRQTLDLTNRIWDPVDEETLIDLKWSMFIWCSEMICEWIGSSFHHSLVQIRLEYLMSSKLNIHSLSWWNELELIEWINCWDFLKFIDEVQFSIIHLRFSCWW